MRAASLEAGKGRELSSGTPFCLRGHVGLLTLVLFQATPRVVIGYIINRKPIHRLKYDQGCIGSWKVLETERVPVAQRREEAGMAAELTTRSYDEFVRLTSLSMRGPCRCADLPKS